MFPEPMLDRPMGCNTDLIGCLRQWLILTSKMQKAVLSLVPGSRNEFYLSLPCSLGMENCTLPRWRMRMVGIRELTNTIDMSIPRCSGSPSLEELRLSPTTDTHLEDPEAFLGAGRADRA